MYDIRHWVPESPAVLSQKMLSKTFTHFYQTLLNESNGARGGQTSSEKNMLIKLAVAECGNHLVQAYTDNLLIKLHYTIC